jgi:hypothetical protein
MDMDTELDSLRAATKKITGLVGSVKHAAAMANASSGSGAGVWFDRKVAELRQAEDDLAVLLAVRKAQR